MGGILGTIAILLESSGVGGDIYLDDIPKPQELEMVDWLKTFLSFGFVLSADLKEAGEILRIFEEKGIAASIIGEVRKNKVVDLVWGKEREVLFDFNKEAII